MGAFPPSLYLYLSLYPSSTHSFLCHTISCASVKVYLKYISHGCTHTPTGTHTHVRTAAKLHCPAAYWVCNLAQVKLWNSFHFLSLATNSTSQRANDSRATLSVSLSLPCPPSLTLWFINFLMNKRIIDWQGMKNGIGKGRMGEQGSVACFVVCFLPYLALPGLCCFTLRTMRRMSNVVCLPRVELSLPQLPSAAST